MSISWPIGQKPATTAPAGGGDAGQHMLGEPGAERRIAARAPGQGDTARLGLQLAQQDVAEGGRW